jgi:hypothetical protein
MDPFIQVSSGFHSLELQQMAACPIEQNTKLTYDPRFLASQYKTNELNIQESSGVLGLLQKTSGFTQQVPDYVYRK